MRTMKEIREAAGISISDLAARADVNHWTIRKIEWGHALPAPSVAARLARALGMPVEEIEFRHSYVAPPRAETLTGADLDEPLDWD